MREPIQITRSGAVKNADPGALEELQQEFAKNHCILLPSLIDPAIFEFVVDSVAKASFVAREYKDVGTEKRLPGEVSTSSLDFLMNVPRFLQIIERVTCCEKIALFYGRIYQMTAAEGHQFNWHDDMESGDPRLLGLSLNLSREPFEGGELEIREMDSQRVVHKVRNTGLGDAIIFRIAANLEHRVAPVRGVNSKIAYAGWFRPTSREYPAGFHNLLRSGEE
jgi:hypothetical protein